MKLTIAILLSSVLLVNAAGVATITVANDGSGRIVGPVSAATIASANGFGGAGAYTLINGIGTNITLQVTNVYGSTSSNQTFVITFPTSLLISNYWNTNVGGGSGGLPGDGTTIITNGSSKLAVYTNTAGVLYNWVTNAAYQVGLATGWYYLSTNIFLNLPISGFDPQYFTKNGNEISFVVQNQLTDTRPLADADLKGVFPPSNTLYCIFTNNGPCTMTSIRIDLGNIPFYTGQYLLPTLSIFEDGVSNGCQLPMFFSAMGFPSLAFHGDSIDIQQGANFNANLGVQRTLSINCKTNGSICITFPTNGFQLWSDVNYRVGSPVVSNTWHMKEVQSTSTLNQVVSVGSASGTTGQAESVVAFLLANGEGYLESRPTLYLDNVSPFLANGTEDFFGGSWYWTGGIQAYGTPQWGNESENFLAQKYGFADGNCSYRFFQNAYFRTNMVFNYTNLSGTISNDFLLTWFTIP